MKKSVSFSKVRGRVRAPASKSALQRLIALSWLSQGDTEILYPDYCNDVASALGIVESLGAQVIKNASSIIIRCKGAMEKLKGRSVPLYLNCGESGLAIRMFSPVVTLTDCGFVLDAKGSLLKRPSGVITETLKSFGVNASDNGGFPPVSVRGPLPGGCALVDGSLSSQILTGLLLALPVASSDSEVHVRELKSKPYIDMTIELAGIFGCEIKNSLYEVFSIKGGQSYLSPGSIAAEGDWSSASFLLASAALSKESDLRIDNLRVDSKQADRAMLDVIRSCGVNTETGKGYVRISRGNNDLAPFEFDATDSPDLFPPLVALASGCEGVSVIHGVQRLKHKESDRELSLVKEFTKGGIKIESDGERITVRGGIMKNFEGDAHNDHRIAMALASSAATGENRILIEGSESVAKSYPGFFDDLKIIGGCVDE